ncbi:MULTISPECIES: GPW/gp25 family protein [Yersinia]|uniref:GPW/gp25 family protein n=1 Tax=Yersinia TaxID=629 RepID=UPI00094BA261|nr:MULTISPECIES: GPW/gp25 family protein [Yersinia]MBW5812525.1 GPW/gp25 family protein [Yersinia kristensenii]MBW5817904.1 GPW/gp25 family protein [Yersinia kristensenii]MBW5829826.1 GPW/gp25 family protein [Yersinia kristensenii]MBW5842220.1 GPW/gp25 family protein [Yersinia kristensenii]MDA5490320.1 GPW/gp25 family protein [Yersinia kristensenii]
MNSLLSSLSDNNVSDSQQSESIMGDKNSILSAEIMMILSTRPCESNISDIPWVNTSILNYGVSDIFGHDIPKIEIAAILAARIKMALIRFEPRLHDIQVAAENKNGSFYYFIIQANSVDGPVCYRIMWDDVISRFSLLE